MLLTRLTRDSRVPLRAKLIAAAGVAYALSPIELLPEIVLGPVGLIAWVVLLGAAILAGFSRMDELVTGVSSVLAPGNVPLLILAFAREPFAALDLPEAVEAMLDEKVKAWLGVPGAFGELDL